MTVVHDENGVTVHHAACLDVLRELDDASVHAVCTDPPYGLGDHRPDAIVTALTAWANGDRERVPDGKGFMGRVWDAFVPPPAVWDECLRVLKPGGHLVCFAGARTIDLMGLSIRMAGFEVRDTIGLAGWAYSSGFPKSLDVSKAIDREARVEREVIGTEHRMNEPSGLVGTGEGERVAIVRNITAPPTDAARRWEGWGTALSPACEPLIIAQKPLADRDILAAIGSELDRLEGECSSIAKPATQSSAPTRRDEPAAKTGSAHESAATQPEDDAQRPTSTGEEADTGSTATSWSGETTAATCANTVSSWRSIWVALCETTSTSTTSTTSETTTDLRTLWSSLSKITGASMAACLSTTGGDCSTVEVADSLFGVCLLRQRITRASSATGPATGSTPISRQDGTDPASPPELVPAIEPIIVARKPLDGTVAQTVTRHGTGALNIDACRVGAGGQLRWSAPRDMGHHGGRDEEHSVATVNDQGRWPKNFLLTHAPLVDDAGEVIGDACADGCVPDCHVAELDAQTGILRNGGDNKANLTKNDGMFMTRASGNRVTGTGYAGDSGGASRFFPVFRYEAKAPSSERPMVGGVSHPTVKPLSLMAWLVRLVTPPGGTVVDPFAGSGTTGLAAAMQGFRAILVEREPSEPGAPDHIAMIRARLARRPREARPDTPPRKPAPEGQVDLFASLDDESA